MDDDGWYPEELRHRLVARLVHEGKIRSTGWQTAFERVPRHLFVPYFYRRAVTDSAAYSYELVDGRRSTSRHAWLEAVYSDETLVIQLDGATPTSSSTSPGHMARMLEALNVDDSRKVLEIGTGTGYNAALLCERLGSKAVVTVDVDAGLVDKAIATLRAAGHAPTVVAAEGRDGCSTDAPFDRLIATCSVTKIPQAWLDQTRPGGIVVADVRGTLGNWGAHWSALVRLEVHEGGTARGRFLPWAGNFISVRGGMADLQERLQTLGNPWGTRGDKRTTKLSPNVLGNEAFCIFAGLTLQNVWDLQLEVEAEDSSPKECVQAWCLVDHVGGSLARLDGPVRASTGLVTQSGSRRLWDELESAYQRWLDLGKPDRDRYRLTVTPEGKQFVLVDSPDGPTVGELPS